MAGSIDRVSASADVGNAASDIDLHRIAMQLHQLAAAASPLPISW
jgi:hypothetical protein